MSAIDPKNNIDWEKLPAGNYLVRGDLGMLIHCCGAWGQVQLVERAEDLAALLSPLPGERLYVLYELREPQPPKLPPEPPPPRCWRLVVGRPETNYKQPPAGYQTLDARSLGRWEPAVDYARRYPDTPKPRQPEDWCEELLHAVLRLDPNPWRLPTHRCYQLFGAEAESPFFRRALPSPAAYAHWRHLAPHLPLKTRVFLYGCWLVFLQRRQRALVRTRTGSYLFCPRLEPALSQAFGWQNVPDIIIEERAKRVICRETEFCVL